jgi:hypothetical protein
MGVLKKIYHQKVKPILLFYVLPWMELAKVG